MLEVLPTRPHQSTLVSPPPTIATTNGAEPEQESDDQKKDKSLAERMGTKGNMGRSQAIRVSPLSREVIADAHSNANWLLGSEISKVVYPLLGNLDRPIS